ncbi:MAG: hypothetical protein LBN01_00185 [Endomicrobium sp.]|jgi:hypothetical protein|nr:hypothetical protein [Endomicrobium sp.]
MGNHTLKYGKVYVKNGISYVKNRRKSLINKDFAYPLFLLRLLRLCNLSVQITKNPFEFLKDKKTKADYHRLLKRVKGLRDFSMILAGKFENCHFTFLGDVDALLKKAEC